MMSGGEVPRDSGRQQDAPNAEVDAVLAEFGDDARAAIAALLHDIASLAADAEANVSRGFTRGRSMRWSRMPGS